MDDPLADARMERYNPVHSSGNYRNLKRVDENSTNPGSRLRSNQQGRTSTRRSSGSHNKFVTDPYDETAQTPRRGSLGGKRVETTQYRRTLDQRPPSGSFQPTYRNDDNIPQRRTLDQRPPSGSFQPTYRNDDNIPQRRTLDQRPPSSSFQPTYRNNDNNSVGIMSDDSSMGFYHDDVSTGTPNDYHGDHYSAGYGETRSSSSRNSSRGHSSTQRQTRSKPARSSISTYPSAPVTNNFNGEQCKCP